MKTKKKYNEKVTYKKFRRQIAYHSMVAPGIVFCIIFCYIPMAGLVIAFEDFSFRKGIFGSPLVGFKYFVRYFSDIDLLPVVYNTLILSTTTVVFTFLAILLFTLLLNEIKSPLFKRIVQTTSYLPHFVSWVVVSVIIITFLSPSEGIVNYLLVNSGLIKEPVLFIGRPELYWMIATFSYVWKEVGWGTIMFLAIISNIDSSLYEAASVDGAKRFKKMLYITLPSLKGIIAIWLILSVSSMPNIGYEQAFFLSNSLNISKANVLSYYVYNTGLVNAEYSYATAMGLILSAVSATLMLVSNKISNKMTGKGLI